MKFKAPVYAAILVIAISSVTAFADQIVLKDGAVYSGKFIRGDERTVDFKVLGRVESFKVANVSQIIFMEPELQTQPYPRASKALVDPEPPEIPADMSEPISSISASQPEYPRLVVQPPPPPVNNNVQAQPDAYSAMIFPKGTPVVIRTISEIDTDRNRVGDVFEATLEDAMVWGNQTVFPRGTTVKGRIAYAKESGKLSGQSQLVLELTDIVGKDRSYFLRTSDYTEIGSSRGNRTAAAVGGTAALGAIIGAIAGGGKGAAIGAASGAAVGTGVQVVTRGEVLRIPVETVLEFKLQSALKVDP